jgi:signal recognition particle subunit SRP19
LVDAAKAAGFNPTETNDQVRFPKRPYVRSGYIILPKDKVKSKIISSIAEKLVSRRAKQSK